MIYVVAIPVSGQPHCWSAKSRADFIRKVAGAAGMRVDGSETFDQWVDIHGRDLESLYIYESAAEANDALRSLSIVGHGSGRDALAFCALREELTKNGDIADDLFGGNE
jgi:hypothetical protein